MVIISDIISVSDLVMKATKLVSDLPDTWYKGSAELKSFKTKLKTLRLKCVQWTTQLDQFGMAKDPVLRPLLDHAATLLNEEEDYFEKHRNRRAWKFRRRVFPAKLTYILDELLIIVEGAHRRLAAAIVEIQELLEKDLAMKGSPLPFGYDSTYVPLPGVSDEVQRALEDPKGQRVVTLYGEPGIGKSSLAKYVALLYEDSIRGSLPCPFDGVQYLFCGKGCRNTISQMLKDLLSNLGLAVSDLVIQKQNRDQILSFYRNLLRKLSIDRHLLIILDDVWEEDFEVLVNFISCESGIRYLLTSQTRNIWFDARTIEVSKPDDQHALQILISHTEGWSIDQQPPILPKDLEITLRQIIRKVENHPLSLINVAASVRRHEATNSHQWTILAQDIYAVLDQSYIDQAMIPVHERPYSLSGSASMMLMVESLPPPERELLFLVAMIENKWYVNGIPKDLIRILFQRLHPGGNSLHQYLLALESLQDKSLISTDTNDEQLGIHDLRRLYIRHHYWPALQKIASDVIAPKGGQGTRPLLQAPGDFHSFVVGMSGVCFQNTLTGEGLLQFQSLMKNMNGGVIPHWLNLKIDAQGWKQQVQAGASKSVYTKRSMIMPGGRDDGGLGVGFAKQKGREVSAYSDDHKNSLSHKGDNLSAPYMNGRRRETINFAEYVADLSSSQFRKLLCLYEGRLVGRRKSFAFGYGDEARIVPLEIVQDVENELKRGREDGFVISVAWFFGLGEHHREALMALFSRAGYSQFYQTNSYVCFERFKEQAQIASLCTVDDSPLIPSAIAYFPQDSTAITALKRFIDLWDMESTDSDKPANQEATQGRELEKGITSETANSEELNVRSTGKTAIRLGPKLLQHSVPADKGLTLESFMSLLRDIRLHGCCVSTQWLSSLNDHDYKILTSACVKAGYSKVYTSVMVTCLERIWTQTETSKSCNHGSNTEASVTGGNIDKMGTTTAEETPQNDLVNSNVGSKDTTAGLTNATSASSSLHLDDNCPCLPQKLKVRTLSSSYSAVACNPVAGPVLKYTTCSQFGDIQVFLPRQEKLMPSTKIRKDFCSPGIRSNGSRNLQVLPISMNVEIENTLSCCVQNQDCSKKVRIKISRVRGFVASKSPADAEVQPIALVLKSVRINVDACVARCDTGESEGAGQDISLDILPPRRRVLESCPEKSSDRVWLALSAIDPENSEVGSRTVELICNVKDTAVAAADGSINGTHVLLFHDFSQPVQLEGHLDMGSHHMAVLTFDIRYQAEVSCLVPCPTAESSSSPFMRTFRKVTIIEFDRRLEFRTAESLPFH